jgi:tetratricopeptide (TPR) repeat protein
MSPPEESTGLPAPVAGVALLTFAFAGFGLFNAGRWIDPLEELVRAESQMEKGRHKDAVRTFDALLAVHPEMERARLLRIEALLLSGDLKRGMKEMERGGLPSGPLGERVVRTAARVNRALLEYNTALIAHGKGDFEEAVHLIRRARQEFPESGEIRGAYLNFEGLLAFDAGKMREYVGAHELLARVQPDDPLAVALHSLAVAARYALDRKPEDRELARSLLQKAEGLALSPEAEDFVRAAGREVRFRLTALQMRRFPGKQQ